jgi:hypothetical protein
VRHHLTLVAEDDRFDFGTAEIDPDTHLRP